MELPEIPHEVFPRTALRTVICQVRYEGVLEISERSPADFQRDVKKAFPRLEPMEELTVAPFGVAQPTQHRLWRFLTKDRRSVLSLGPGAMALESSSYSGFSEFRSLLEVGINALGKAYGVPFFSRVGLRYVNEVHRQATGGDRISWAEWINEDLVGKIGEKIGAGCTFDLLSFLRMTFPDGVSWTLRTGVRRTEDESVPWESFTLDSDQFTDDETSFEDTMPIIDSLHKWGWRVFRWAAGNELLARLRATEPPREGVVLGSRQTVD